MASRAMLLRSTSAGLTSTVLVYLCMANSKFASILGDGGILSDSAVVRRDEADRSASASRCSSPAGASLASVSAGAPGSRPQASGEISPDGRWLTYSGNDSGTLQVYVRPYPTVNSGRWQVSTNGGLQPVWARDGRELFYVAPDGALMRVGVGNERSWAPSAPTKVVERGYFVGSGSVGGNPFRNYDVSADGQRFLMMKAGSSDQVETSQQIVVVQHFDEELKRLVPTK